VMATQPAAPTKAAPPTTGVDVRLADSVLSTCTDDELVAALEQKHLRRAAETEIRGRVKELGNVANCLMYRYISPATGADKHDAWEGLVGCCWKARGNLFVAGPEVIESIGNTDLFESTRNFIVNALKTYIRRQGYRKLGRAAIARLALNKELRWAPTVVHNKLVDRVRKVTAARRKARKAAERAEESTVDSKVGDGMLLRSTLRTCAPRFIAALGKELYELVFALAKEPLGATRRQRKGASTRFIAEYVGRSRGRRLPDQRARFCKRQIIAASVATGDDDIIEPIRQLLGSG
jgi:hypothetical protein